MTACLRKSIAVLGGGITGLTAAYRLAGDGHHVRLFEKSGRLGGAIRTELADGWLVEAGPNSLQEDSPEVTGLLHDLGLDAERIAANPSAQNRYLVRNGRLVAAPASPSALAFSPLLSTRAKLQVLGEWRFRPSVRVQDISAAGFFRSHFGSEILDRIVQPFVSGTWAGDSARLSARAAFPKFWEMEQTHGSLLRGQIAAAKTRHAREGAGGEKMISFRRGLQTLPCALTARLPNGTVTLNASISGLALGDRWQVIWRHGENTHRENFDLVIASLPAASLADLAIGQPDERPLSTLAEIEHPPLASFFLGFRREQVAHPLDGFGLLVPPSERRSMLGAIFSSSLFPGRAPAGCVALTVMAGGALQPEITRLPIAELQNKVCSDLRDLLGTTGNPVFMRHTFWPQSIPQYNLGHERHVETIARCEQKHSGLFIGGQVRNGISLPQCISAGGSLAERAVRAN